MPNDDQAKKIAALVQSSGIINPDAKLSDLLMLAQQASAIRMASPDAMRVAAPGTGGATPDLTDVLVHSHFVIYHSE